MGIAERLIDIVGTSQYLQVESSLCSRSRTPKSGCSLCADMCPGDAVILSDTGARISGACVDCGACFSICPNGAFTLKQGDDSQIIREMDAVLERQGPAAEKEIRLSCEQGAGEADVLVPCLARLTEALFLEAATAGFSKIIVLKPECQDCRNAKASPHIERVMKCVAALVEMAGIERDRIVVQGIALKHRAKQPGQALSRRDLFSELRQRAAEVAAAALPGSAKQANQQEPAFLETTASATGNVKRTLLLRSLARVTPMKAVFVPSEDSILAQMEVSSQCTACGVCATLCPVGALAQKWDDKRFILTFRPSLCTNCRICVETCMPKAITAAASTRLNDLLDDAELTLFTAGKKTCSLCGIPFVQPSDERHCADDDGMQFHVICPVCVNRHRKQMAFIENGFRKQGGA